MSRPPFPALPPAWETAIAAWVGHLRLRGLSAATQRVRRDHVRTIARRSGTEGPGDITGPGLAALCSAPDWSADHRKAMRASLRSFYDYCKAAGITGDDPTAWLPAVKPPSPCPRPVTDDIWAALLTNAGPRERLMALLAGEAGLRRAEVAQVHRDDLIDGVDGWSLIVRGKGRKQRVVPLTDDLADAIRDYCPGGGFLFPGTVGGHICVVYVGQLISELMPDGWSIHKLRHRAATRGYAGTHNLRAVQEFLGHASVATTQRYTAVTTAQIRAVSEAARAPR